MTTSAQLLSDPPLCNVCQTHNTRVVARLESDIDGNAYNAATCKECGLVFTHPMPALSFDTLQDIYGDEYTEFHRDVAEEQILPTLRAAINRQMDIVESYTTKGLALNLGAMGSEIGVLEERGWQLRIIEVSSYAAESARKQWGFDVTVAKIEDFDCPPETFDFIKLGHVIEHLTDPRQAVQKLVTLLKPGGTILIDTDNAGGLKTQVEVGFRRVLGENLSSSLVQTVVKKNLRKRYGRLTPPEHVYCFTESSLVKLLRDGGLNIVETFKPAWGDPTWFPLTNEENLKMAEKVMIKVDQVGARFGYGDVIAVLAQKPA